MIVQIILSVVIGGAFLAFLSYLNRHRIFFRVLYRNKVKIFYKQYGDTNEGFLIEDYPMVKKRKIVFFGINTEIKIVDYESSNLTIIPDKNKNPEYFL